MKVFDIWSEGYAISGNMSGAIYHGSIEAEDFTQACNEFFKSDIYFDVKCQTHWGCRLFDNEPDARKSFG